MEGDNGLKREKHCQGIDIQKNWMERIKCLSDFKLSLFQLQSAKNYQYNPSQSLGETPFNPWQ